VCACTRTHCCDGWMQLLQLGMCLPFRIIKRLLFPALLGTGMTVIYVFSPECWYCQFSWLGNALSVTALLYLDTFGMNFQFWGSQLCSLQETVESFFMCDIEFWISDDGCLCCRPEPEQQHQRCIQRQEFRTLFFIAAAPLSSSLVALGFLRSNASCKDDAHERSTG
jgi:hypothetical protein